MYPISYYFSGYRNMEENPAGNQSVYYFDKKGRPIAEENPLGETFSKKFDGQNQIIETTDPRLNTTTYTYDGNHNLRYSDDALSKESENVYDAQFHLTDTYDPLRNRGHYEYFANHHLQSTTIYPETGVEIKSENTYHTNGLPWTIIDGRLTQTTKLYDQYGNPDTTQTGAHPAIDYTYDSIGRLTDVY